MSDGDKGKGVAGVNLDAMTVEQLTMLRDAAEAKRMEKLDGEKDAILTDARAKLKALGLPFDDFFKKPMTSITRKERKGSGAKVAAKYRNTETGETWTGRGREPAWIKGKDRTAFAV